jgi:glyoxylase-like metal-dependent hydrolase (beta-lactamase superfamily II)
MQQILPGVHRFRDTSSNVYLLASDPGLAMIDTGAGRDVTKIVDQLDAAGHSLSELHTIVLTHAHGDHAGGLSELARRSGARILAHRLEVPYVEGTQSLPAGSFLQRLMKWITDLMSRQQRCQVDQALEEGDVIPFLGGVQVLHTPGHTPGSICLYRQECGLLFCGDLFFNGNLLTGRSGLRYAPSLFSVDPEQARRSARRIAGLDVQVLCAGHGEPILHDAQERLAALVDAR